MLVLLDAQLETFFDVIVFLFINYFMAFFFYCEVYLVTFSFEHKDLRLSFMTRCHYYEYSKETIVYEF